MPKIMRHGKSPKPMNTALIVVAAGILVFTGYLVLSNYRSQVQLRATAVERFEPRDHVLDQRHGQAVLVELLRDEVPPRDLQDLGVGRVLVALVFQVCLPRTELTHQMRIGMVAAEQPDAGIAHPPGAVAAQVAAQQVGGIGRAEEIAGGGRGARPRLGRHETPPIGIDVRDAGEGRAAVVLQLGHLCG